MLGEGYLYTYRNISHCMEFSKKKTGQQRDCKNTKIAVITCRSKQTACTVKAEWRKNKKFLFEEFSYLS